MTDKDVDKLMDAWDDIFKKKTTRGAVDKIAREMDKSKREKDDDD